MRKMRKCDGGMMIMTHAGVRHAKAARARVGKHPGTFG